MKKTVKKKTAKKSYDKVHPEHYRSHPITARFGVECIDIIEHLCFNAGAAIKYLWRGGLKPGESTLDDLKKAAWFVNREISRVSKNIAEERKPSRKKRS